MDPVQPAPFHAIIYTIVSIYLLYSSGVLAFLRIRTAPLGKLTVGIQIIDVAWISLLTVLTGGATSPFFVFFTFALVAAAYRWSFWETVCSGALAGLSYYGPAVYMLKAAGQTSAGGAEFNRVLLRTAYLMLMSLFLGYLAQNEKRLRRENALIARAVAKAKA